MSHNNPVARHYQPEPIGSEDPSRAGSPTPVDSFGKSSNRPKTSRKPSWDLFGGLGNSHEFEEFDVRKAGVANLEFAEGDVASNKFTKFYYYLITKSTISRWFVYIVPVLIVSHSLLRCLVWQVTPLISLCLLSVSCSGFPVLFGSARPMTLLLELVLMVSVGFGFGRVMYS